MSYRMKERLISVLVTAAALLLGAVIVLPVVYGVFGAFKSPSEFLAYPPSFLPADFGHLDNFRHVLATVPVGRYFLNSLAVALIMSTVRVALAVLAAYAFAYFDFAGKRVLFLVILGTMMLPADTLLVTNYQTVARLGLIDTYLGMCITGFVGASAMFMLRQNFRTIPKAFFDAARIDGCGDVRYIVSVLAPISRPVLATLWVQAFVSAWNSYLWPLMVTNHNDMRTVQVGVTMLTTVDATNYEVVLAGVALSLIPAFLIFLALRRNITRSMTAGALVG